MDLPDGGGVLCTGIEAVGSPPVLGGCGGYNVCNSPDFVCDTYKPNRSHSCMSVAACRYLRDSYGDVATGTCFFDDLTESVAGTVSAPTCNVALQSASLCGVGCPCLDGSSCFGLSEQHPIGLCAPFPIDSCRQASDCHSAGAVCVVSKLTPGWIDDSWFPPDGGGFLQLRGPAGRCAPLSACQALDAQYPNTWECRQ